MDERSRPGLQNCPLGTAKFEEDLLIFFSILLSVLDDGIPYDLATYEHSEFVAP
jgi:hypothetical protein